MPLVHFLGVWFVYSYTTVCSISEQVFIKLIAPEDPKKSGQSSYPKSEPQDDLFS